MNLYKIIFTERAPREVAVDIQAETMAEALESFHAGIDTAQVDGFTLKGIVHVGVVTDMGEGARFNVDSDGDVEIISPKRPAREKKDNLVDFPGLPPPTITRGVEKIKVIVGDPDKPKKGV